ncbi:uncharacterized protein [Amphiura filiformis]|uniref:uncharacterized protein n=1 Tax=Amphiura filiformis TaxID=82378 RepID=UPI003B220616
MTTAYNQLVDETGNSPCTVENGIPNGEAGIIVLTDIEPSDEVFMMRSIQPKDYFKQAVAIIMCCWLGFPLGVAALLQSKKVRHLTVDGELTQAQEASRLTRTLLFIGLALGLIGWSLLVTVVLIYCLTTEDQSAVESLQNNDDKYNIFVPN